MRYREALAEGTAALEKAGIKRQDWMRGICLSMSVISQDSIFI